MSSLLFINWNPDPVLFEIGPLTMHWYGLTWGLAIILSYLLLERMFKREKINEENLVNVVIIFAICGLLGARFGQVFFYDWSYFAERPEEMLKIWKGGLASHGGMIGCLIGLLISWKLYKIPIIPLMDKSVIAGCMAGGLIRIGNLFNSELVGKETDVNWAFVFESYDKIPRHPVVLYEAIMMFSVFALFNFLYWRSQTYKPGTFVGLFFSVIFSCRLLLEFCKESDVFYEIGPALISKTQILSIPLIVMGILILVLSRKNFFGSDISFGT